MRFTKAHGAGNDFVLIDDLDGKLQPNAAFVAALCDRHFGVGADGLIRITRAPGADFFMDYYNADGEVAEMCGNGIRTLAKYVADRGIHAGDTMRVDTRAGVKDITVYRGAGGKVDRARVDMGAPILGREAIPMSGEGDPQHHVVVFEGQKLDATCVSMGNPHCIVWVQEIPDAEFARMGPAIETDRLFPAKTNVEFTKVLNDHEVRVRVWERGVGETLACGTGACATAVAAALCGYTGRAVAVHLPGGTLDIEWAADDHVYMTGPAEESFEGELGAHLTSLLPAPSTTKG